MRPVTSGERKIKLSKQKRGVQCYLKGEKKSGRDLALAKLMLNARNPTGVIYPDLFDSFALWGRDTFPVSVSLVL
jgi:hypothetical protein